MIKIKRWLVIYPTGMIYISRTLSLIHLYMYIYIYIYICIYIQYIHYDYNYNVWYYMYSLSQQHILNQLETAVLDSTHSMHQLEVFGASLLLKLLVTDLWTFLWTILFIHLMWENSSLLISITCSVLDVKSHLSQQHILNQLETAVLDSFHTMHSRRLHQDEVQL